MIKSKISQVLQFFVVLELFTKYYIKSLFGPLFNFLFSPLIYAILGTLLGFKVMLPGIMAMIGVSIGLLIMPFSIIGLKKSVLLKRIGASPVKPGMFTFVMCFFFLLVVFFSSLWLSLCALVISLDTTIFDSLNSAKGFFNYLYGLLINILLSISLGFVITSFSKSEIHAQSIGLLCFFPIAFLSGQFLSPSLIASSPVMEWTSRLIPFRYSTMMMTESWVGDFKIPGLIESNANIWSVHDYTLFMHQTFEINDILDYTSGIKTPDEIILQKLKNSAILIYDKADHIVSFCYPYVASAIFLTIGIKAFSWSASR